MSTSKLCTTEEMIERIKDVLSRQSSYEGKKVFDADVAAVLGIDKIYVATLKRRNTIPFEKIILFCDRCGYPPMKIFMKSC